MSRNDERRMRVMNTKKARKPKKKRKEMSKVYADTLYLQSMDVPIQQHNSPAKLGLCHLIVLPAFENS